MKTKKAYQRPVVEVIEMGVPVLLSFSYGSDDEVDQWSEEKNGGWNSQDWNSSAPEE